MSDQSDAQVGRSKADIFVFVAYAVQMALLLKFTLAIHQLLIFIHQPTADRFEQWAAPILDDLIPNVSTGLGDTPFPDEQ